MAAAERKPSLVERLFAEHRGALQTFFLRRICAKADALDLAQEVYVRMLRISDEAAIRNPVHYLYTVANNLVKEHAVLDRRQASGIDIDEAPAHQELERIEILEGPQGTLFGAGAEAGVVRYITNKPKLDLTEAKVNAGYATTAHGDQSSNVDATLNIPLIAGKLAVRGVIYNEKRGGYIDNIPATFARATTDLSIYYANAAGQAPTDSVGTN